MVEELSVRQAATRLGVSVTRIIQLRKQAKLHASQRDRRWFYSAVSVEALYAEREHTPPRPSKRPHANPSPAALANRRSRERRAARLAVIKAASESGI